jgi:hypothetical protein
MGTDIVVSDKTKFKRLLFTVLTLSLLVSAVMLSVGLLSWFAGLGDWGNRHYRSWLAIEILLVSVATVLFVFYRKPSMHPFERPLPARRLALGNSDSSKRIGWWSMWFLAWLMFVIPTALQFFEIKQLGVLRAALALWWLVDLVSSGAAIMSNVSKNKTFRSNEPKLVETFWEKFSRIERSLLTLFVFLQCTASTIVCNSAPVWISYLFALLLVVAALAIRVVYLPFDHRSLFGQSFLFLFRMINRFWNWHELPKWVGIANLAALREELRIYNLHSTSLDKIAVTNPQGLADPTHPSATHSCPFSAIWRNSDGSYNDPVSPTMGIASHAPTGSSSIDFTHSHPDSRFGRNMPFDALEPSPNASPSRCVTPNPRIVSCKLLARDPEQPGGQKLATTLNLLAAAWIQFQTHGWFSHGTPIEENSFQIDTSDDPPHDRWPFPKMSIRRTRPDPTRSAQDGQNAPDTYVNSESHWWDASQIYGSQASHTEYLKSASCPYLSSVHVGQGDAKTGFFDNWWLGLSLLHELFVKEHNAICDALQREYPSWSKEHIFEKARLINAALMAKIHTVEWTPAILANPMLEVSMNANWNGLFSDRIINALGRIGLNEAFWGIPESGINHHSAPYALTEEFVAVYRMHSLMPETITLKSWSNPENQQVCSMQTDQGVVGQEGSLSLWHSFSHEDVLYSFGIQNPGALTLNNYPAFLRRFHKPVTGELLDLATIDILRDRERQIPRYNRFRTELRMKPIGSFDEFNSIESPKTGSRLREVYGTNPDGTDKVEDLDLLVGSLAEAKPEGFGFSDTTFRIFILMASRRLKSDRFTAQDFTADVFTKIGLNWVNNTTMKDVILRHFPNLAAPMAQTQNAFKPWR